MAGENRHVDVLVIGAGQAGLSAAYHLLRRQFKHPDDIAGDTASGTSNSNRTFLIIDANPSPGGAWQHRWDSLTMATVNNIYDLPGMPQAEVDSSLKASTTLMQYFGDFEAKFNLRVERPVKAIRVERVAEASASESESSAAPATTPKTAPAYRTTLDDGRTIDSTFIINATGTWNSPHVPYVPGIETFRGKIYHTQTYRDAKDFAGQRVAIVGAGISATGHLAEVSKVADTMWFTRRPPEFREDFNGHDSVALVEERVRKGLPPQSVVSVTGLGWKPELIDAKERGVLQWHPMFERMDATGVITPDGKHHDFDAIIFGTGFRSDLRHLAPLKLRNELGGITMDPPQVVDEPRVFLVGYGPSASTVGANRAGRDAVIRIRRILKEMEATR